ncbi:Fe2+-dicitrate sensor, membrane component [Pseudomonas cichorii]|uniref:Fe2+-dicitrate sensor, membrane component n=1 Tax=Pseudomonas cichorii TaxID=36746 RepID=A0A3M4LP93_PSECI|nr:FecR domain-containing protein [Pseudomonas cichorii]RMQ43298.1 Fe2+-dicitrate sensor, membrane component [Pseudomonas cichorii]
MSDMARDQQARQVAHAAAYWLALLESGTASAQEHEQLQRWREQCPSHEQVWQRAQGLRQRFAELPPELAMASLDRHDSKRNDPSRRAILKRALVIAALIPTGWIISRQLPITAWRADLRTATGERKSLRLPDGSQLQLNTASAVNLDFLDGRRQLALIEGEIALSMAGNAPAVSIDTRMGRIIASGAELCIRQDQHRCRVSVASGSVDLLSAQGASLRLKGGERAALNAQGITPLERFDARQPDWRQGVLTVENRPLASFLTELGRYRPGILRWEPELEALRVTGSFRLDDTDRVLALLAASLPVQVHARTRYWITLGPRNISA